MTNEVIFWTQVSSFATFVVALFVLYRLLVKQKDATIELLRERNDYLKDRLEETRQSAPDILVRNLRRRTKALTEEIEQLNQDQEGNVDLIRQRERELTEAQKAIDQLRTAQEALGEELFCPDCDAPLIVRDVGMYDYHGYDVDFEIREFECGRTLHDDSEQTPCPTATPSC